jgi:hypothetical protein
LFISGYPTGADGFDIGEQGESFLSKPFTKDALLRHLRDVIER